MMLNFSGRPLDQRLADAEDQIADDYLVNGRRSVQNEKTQPLC